VLAVLLAGPLGVRAADSAPAAGTASAPPAAPAVPAPADPSSPSATFSGITGLVRVPTADTLAPGEGRYQLNLTRSGPESLSPGGAAEEVSTLSLLPHTEIAISDSRNEGALGHDFVAYGKLNVWQETARHPGIALGALDVSRTAAPVDATYFAVASKHFAGDRVEGTLGLAAGQLHGVLAGLSLRPLTWLELQGEYDTTRFNYGAAVEGTILRGQFFARVAQVDVGTAYTLGYQYPLGYPGAPAHPAPKADLGPPAPPLKTACTFLIQDELVRRGLENVQVQIQPVHGIRTLVVVFENREYTLDDYDAVNAALPVAARLADADVQQVAVRVQKRGLTMAEVTSPLDAYRRFARGEITVEQYVAQVTVQRLPGGHPTDVLTSATDVANPPWGRLDLTLAPRLMTKITTAKSQVLTGWSLEPGLTCPLGRGLQADARWEYPVAGPLTEGQRDKLIADEELLSYAVRPGRVMVQGLGGRFSDHTFQHWDGYGAELAVPAGNYGLFHATAARVQNDALGTNTYALGEYWQEIPAWNAQVRVFGGRFLYQDNGYGVDLIRFSREVEVSVGLRRVGGSNVMEVRTSFPLSPRRQPQVPAAVRPRLADYFDSDERALLAANNLNAQADQVGDELAIGPNLVDAFFNRDRLSTRGFLTYLRGDQ
jgi:hypothetical protein